MIIFGIKTRNKDYGKAYQIECPRCTNQVLFHGYKERKWFHIFWVPLIPWFATRGFVCPVCSHLVETDRGGLKLAQSAAETVQLYSDEQASERELKTEFEAIDEYLGFEIDDSEDEPDESVASQ